MDEFVSPPGVSLISISMDLGVSLIIILMDLILGVSLIIILMD